jgi:hypothetical protein
MASLFEKKDLHFLLNSLLVSSVLDSKETYSRRIFSINFGTVSLDRLLLWPTSPKPITTA